MQSPEKILIVRFSSLGDIVLASPLIRALRRRFPKAQIDFLVKSEYADLVRFNHHLSSIIELRDSRITELLHLGKKLRRERYDMLLDLHNSLRSRFVRTITRAREMAVVDKQVLARFLLITFKWNTYKGVVPVAERYLKTGKRLGIHDDGKGLEIFIPDETQFGVSSMMSACRLDKYEAVVGIAPCAKHNTKMWLPDRFADVALTLAQAHHAKVLLLGGKEDAGRCEEIARRVNSALKTDAVENLAGRLSLLETASALDFCDTVLCNDTGIMHLAAARQRSVVAIFGPTVKEFGFFPYATQATVVEQTGLGCRPCTHIGSRVCPRAHFRCMRDTTVDHVLHAVTTMMHQQRPA